LEKGKWDFEEGEKLGPMGKIPDLFKNLLIDLEGGVRGDKRFCGFFYLKVQNFFGGGKVNEL
jgi:hypothetical protein